MYYYIKGELALANESFAVIDCGGVGYKLMCSGNTLRQLPDCGKQAKLFTYLKVSEDAQELIGFASEDELGCFKKLITVSGVGAKAGMAILTELTPAQFALVTVTGDVKALSKAPGIGSKLAQRIILELKDKIKNDELIQQASGQSGGLSLSEISGGNVSEALDALAVLGYTKAEASNALKNLDSKDMPVEEMVKQALRLLMNINR